MYIAIEPFFRRRWPQVLVSWTRLLSGGWRDSRVARDAFIGCAFGILAYGAFRMAYSLISSWFETKQLSDRPNTIVLVALSGTNYFISAILDLVLNAIIITLLLIGLLFLLRVLLRNQIAALAVATCIMAFLDGGLNPWYFALCLLVFYPLWFFVLMRFGLIAGIFYMFSGHIFLRFPIGFDASAWYAGTGYAALAIFAVFVLYSFRASLGDHPLFGTHRLDD